MLLAVISLFPLAVYLWLERSLIPRRSTREYWNTSSLSPLQKIEGYIYGARTSAYLKLATWKWLMSRSSEADSGGADRYHGKVLTSEDASKLITVKGPVELTNLEHIVPYPVARDIILKDEDQSIAVLECPCRAQKEDSCYPRDVCLVVGEPFAGFVVEHQPSKARRASQAEALEIIGAEERRGHIHTAWFKDVMHNRFYAICNCCSCCCLGMQSYSSGVPRIAHSGYRPEIDKDACTGCGTCAGICPFGAVNIDDALPEIEEEACMGCGVCASHCPSGAVSLALAPDKGVPLAIDKLQHPCFSWALYQP